MNVASPQMRPLAFRWHDKLDDFVTQLAWSPEGTRLAASSVSGQVVICDAPAGHVIHRLEKAHEDGCDAVAWRPDGTAFATAGRDGQWRLWDAATGRLLVEHDTGALWPEHLAWSPTPIGARGPLLLLGAGNKVTLWNAQGEPAETQITFPRAVTDVTWLQHREGLAVACSTGVSFRSASTLEEQTLFAARDPILKMAVSPSGRWLMTGNQDCTVHVWNTENGQEMHMRGYAAKVRQLAWHRGSRWLAAGGGDAISVWDCSGRGPEGRMPTVLEWHPDFISALVYQPGGDWLASGARDGSIAIWAPTQRQSLISGGKISSGVTQLAWSPDNRLLAAAGEDGEIQLLALD